MSRILNSAFVWIGSATHDTSDAFRQRQRERIRMAEMKRNNGAAGKDGATGVIPDRKPVLPDPHMVSVASPIKDSRADLDQRGEDLRKKAEIVAAIYERAFARKEGK